MVNTKIKKRRISGFLPCPAPLQLCVSARTTRRCSGVPLGVHQVADTPEGRRGGRPIRCPHDVPLMSRGRVSPFHLQARKAAAARDGWQSFLAPADGDSHAGEALCALMHRWHAPRATQTSRGEARAHTLHGEENRVRARCNWREKSDLRRWLVTVSRAFSFLFT